VILFAHMRNEFNCV